MKFFKAKKNGSSGIFKSLFAAYFVLLLHVFLLAGIGISVVLFKGVYHYLPWILGGLGIMVLCLFWFFYRKMRAGSADIKEMLSFPEFRGRTVEIKLLGGLASCKIKGNGEQMPLLGAGMDSQTQLLPYQTPADSLDRRLSYLAELYESDIITREELDKAKNRIFND